MEPLTYMAIAAALGLLYVGFRVAMPKTVDQRLADLRHVPVAQLQPGSVVRTAGRLRRAEQGLVAPLSGKPCLAFVLFIKRRGSDEEDSEDRPLSAQLPDARPFWLEEESGRALVDPGERFELALHQAESSRDLTFGSLPPEARARVTSVFETCTDDILGKLETPSSELIMWELLLLDGTAAAVGGAVRRELHPLGHAPPGRGLPAQVMLYGSRKIPLLISDHATLAPGPRD